LLAVAASFLLRGADPDQAREAQKELYAARYDRAAELYRKLLNADPDWAPGYPALVRALIESHRSADAYAAAEQALARAAGTPEAQTAAGLARFRRGEIAKAETHFKAALKLNPNHPGALAGMAAVYGTISKFASRNALLQVAHNFAPEDPAIGRAWAATLEGVAHIAALERALAAFDTASEEARTLRAHIAADKALGGRKLRQLASPYRHASIKLETLVHDVNHPTGVALRVGLNHRSVLTLLLDTGASGIALTPAAARKAGLEPLGAEASEARGIGDQKATSFYRYLAEEVAIGDVTFRNQPISVFEGANVVGHEGLIGADVFAPFLVAIDFLHRQITLDPYRDWSAPMEEPQDAGSVPPGFARVLRFGNHLTVPTVVNQAVPRLFLIDSGASSNFIDGAVAKEGTYVGRDEMTVVKGVQGKVKQVSRAGLVTLQFANFRQQNANLLAMDFEKISDAHGAALGGILGMPVLWQMRLTIDYRNGAVRFEYQPHDKLP
jgi:tetratricopeptide (TPR) repeat protein